MLIIGILVVAGILGLVFMAGAKEVNRGVDEIQNAANIAYHAQKKKEAEGK